MTFRSILLSCSIGLILAGCASTPDDEQDVFAGREKLNLIKAQLSEARSEGLVSYLAALDRASSELVAISTSRVEDASGLPVQRVRALTTSADAASLLADLPQPDETETAATLAGAQAGRQAMMICENGEIASQDCAFVASLLATQEARGHVASMISLAKSNEAIEVSTLNATLQAWSSSLPSEADIADEGFTAQKVTDMACTANWVSEFAQPRLTPPTEIQTAIMVQASTLGKAHSLSTITLCAPEEQTCTARMTCADDPNSTECASVRAAAVSNHCGPIPPAFTAYLSSGE